MRYGLTVPANGTARILVPVSSSSEVMLDGKPVAQHGDVDGVVVDGDHLMIDVGSGRWDFEWTVEAQ